MDLMGVSDRKSWEAFYRLPFQLFQGDPLWIPPLISEQKRQLDVSRNPFFKHCTYKAWLVADGGRVEGRIVAFVDDLFSGSSRPTGFIGFFECANSQPAANALFVAAKKWLKDKAVGQVCGPMNLSIGNECGVQLSGFEFPPVIQMNYTPPYYRELFERAGFTKEHDMYAYRMTAGEVKNRELFLNRLEQTGSNAIEKAGIRVRTLNLRNYKQELRHIMDIYNATMRENWGFTPATWEEMYYSSAPLKEIVDKELVFLAEADGKVVGCSISVPDVNQVMRHIRDGKLFPTGLFKFLYYRSRMDGFRLIFLGVRREYRLKGLDALFYLHTMRRAVELGYEQAELSWISEDNQNLIRIMDKIGADRYKTYRMYRQDV